MATHSVPDILGGEVVLGRPAKKGGALAELVREGLPVKALLLLAERLDIRQAEISEKIGIPKRTLSRRLTQHSRLTAAESDRAVRLAQVYSNAVETLGDGERRLNGSRHRIAPCAEDGRWTSWTPIPASAKSKTCWADRLRRL